MPDLEQAGGSESCQACRTEHLVICPHRHVVFFRELCRGSQVVPVLVADQNASEPGWRDPFRYEHLFQRGPPKSRIKEKRDGICAQEKRVPRASAGERSEVEHGGWYQRREGRLNGLRMMSQRDDAIGDPTGPWESTQ